MHGSANRRQMGAQVLPPRVQDELAGAAAPSIACRQRGGNANAWRRRVSRPACSLLLAILLLALPMLACAADVRASLDRNQMRLGETVTLNLRVDGVDNAAAPDLSALAEDFIVLGTSSNASVNIDNGNRQAQLIFGIVLRPKHAGNLRVPSLEVAGGRTAELQLEVAPPDHAAASSSPDIFVEASTNGAKVYVGQQLSYTLRLYFSGMLVNGALEDPHAQGLLVQRLGDEARYQTQRGGRNYQVIERHYALVPQHAGHLDIPPVNFQGEAIDPNDPNSLFTSGAPSTAQSQSIRVEVLPQPAGSGRSLWLPARRLELSVDGLPAHDQSLRVGQPLNLTMSVQAQGLPFESLPELSLPALDGATVYPDKPVNGTRSDGEWLLGRRQQSFAVVPDRPGTLTIPETTLQWFDVLTGKPETARIEAHSFQVLPAAGSAAVTPAPAASAATPASNTSSSSPASSSSASAAAGSAATSAAAPPSLWRWLALGSFGLWLLSLLAWLLWRRRRPAPPGHPRSMPPAASSPRELRAAFMQAADGGNAARQAQTLLAWARAERPGLQHLGELAEALAAEDQRSAIAALQRQHYGQAALGQSPHLQQAFQRGFVWRSAGTPQDDEPLPPLYPFKLD